MPGADEHHDSGGASRRDEGGGRRSDPHPPPSAGADDAGADLGALVLTLINSRQSVTPKRLVAPGPDPQQLRQLVEAAACAPDHRGLRPWRLIRILDHQRAELSDLFAVIAAERQPPPDAQDLARARAKAWRAPCLLLAVLRRSPVDLEVPEVERAVALGAALMSLLLAAHGLGFGAMLTSGRSVRTRRFAGAFGLTADEQAVCFVSIGRAGPQRRKPRGPAADWLGDWTGRADLDPSSKVQR